MIFQRDYSGSHAFFLPKNEHSLNCFVSLALKFPLPLHIPADTRSAFPVISVQSPVSIQCCWQS